MMPKPIKAVRAIWRPHRSLERAARLVQHAAEPPPEHPRDVWDWTKRKYRIRAAVLLLLNAALFFGLGCFAFWLRTGQYTPFSAGRYWPTFWSVFDPTTQHQVTLIDYLLFPIPVDQVPMMAVIVGLVLASMTAIPILVSMLYRLPFALIFTAIIGFVALLPWLAIMVTFCCIIARWRRIQFSFRFATAMIAMLPLLSYYALATRGVSASAHLSPLEMGKLYIPWVLAIMGACLVMALVLGIARLVNYRPGAIAPLMSVMFAAPVILFEVHVGKDELYYRLLQYNFGPDSRTHFQDQLAAAPLIERAARRRLPDDQDSPEALQAMCEQVAVELRVHLASGQGGSDDVTRLIHEDFALQQYEAVQACERFRAAFPWSRYVGNTLYLQAQAADMRLAPDLTLFRDLLVLHHYQDFPSAASRPVWAALRERAGDSPLAGVARLRLAQLEARDGRVDAALQLLDELTASAERRSSAATASQPATWSSLLAKRPAISTIDIDEDAVLLDARRLKLLLESNRDPQQNDLALRQLLSMDPHHPLYERNLQQLLDAIPQRFPMTRLRDNVLVLLAAAQPSRSVKIERLRSVIEQLAREEGSDALPRARLELGIALQDDNRPEEARALFEEVRARHSDTPWAAEASRRLAAMGVPRLGS